MSSKKIAYFFLFVLPIYLVSNSRANAQTGPDFIEAETRIGYLVKNYPTFPELKGPACFGSIRIGKRLGGSKSWHKYYYFPHLGLDITGGYLSNKRVLGYALGVSPEMLFTQKLSRRFYLGEILGIGLAWFNNPYDRYKNPENTLIGSGITALPHASLGIAYYINPFWSLWIRASAYHASNAHYQLPNIGINISAASLAVRYHPHPAQIIIKDKTPIANNKKIHFNARLGLGINERGKSTGPTGGPKRLTYLTQLYLTKNLAPINKMQAGFEFAYSTGTYDTIFHGDFYSKKQRLRSCIGVFFLGHEFLMGHFSLLTQGGIYFYNPFQRELAKREKLTNTKEKLKTLFIARLGFQYYFKNIIFNHSNQFYTGIYVKTNFGQADFLDLGLGYTF